MFNMKTTTKNSLSEKSTIRYRKNNGRKFPLCDFRGECNNKAYREVYPSLLGGKQKNKGWSYLCRKHFKEEQKRLKGKLPNCSI